MVIPSVADVFGTIPKGLESGWKSLKSKKEQRPSKQQH